MGQCAHFTTCGLAGHDTVDGREYCILHLPQSKGKDLQSFQQTLADHLEAGHCDLRHIVWPAGAGNADLSGRRFLDHVDLTGAVVEQALLLARCEFGKGATLNVRNALQIQLEGAVIRGPLELKIASIRGVILQGATVEGELNVDVDGSLEFHSPSTRFLRRAFVRAIEISGFYAHDAEFARGLVIRSRVQRISLVHATVRELLDFGECAFVADHDFSETAFGDDCLMNLSGVHCRGALRIMAHPVMPSEICIDGLVAAGDVTIAAASGSSRRRLVARDSTPRLHGEVFLTHVDLAECRLVGNVMDKFTFNDVTWASRGRRSELRSVLYDEVVGRSGGAIDLQRTRESYEVLKEFYQKRGDHTTAGHFHYGEMEMRRHGYGNVGSLFCWPFLYWLLSGYGTRPNRALCALAILAGLATVLYWSIGGVDLSWDALRFSLAVTTLQRPEPDKFVPQLDLTPAGSWTQVLQTVLAPMLIALFFLALRMRLRR